MEKILEEMLKKVRGSVRNKEAVLGAVRLIDASFLWLKTPQGVNAEENPFWGVVKDHLEMMVAAHEGKEDALRWLVENCPVDFSAQGSNSTKSFADQAKARLMKLKEPQKVSG